MPSSARTNPVVDFPVVVTDPTLQAVLDVLRQAMGRLTPLLDLPLLIDHAGYTVAAGGLLTINGTYRTLNLADAGITQARLVVDGTTAAGGPITVDVYDATANVVLCSTTVTTTGGVVGAWTLVKPRNTDHTFSFRVHGDGTNAQTLFAATLQLRTASPLF